MIDYPGTGYIYSRLRKSPQQPRLASALPADLQGHTRCELTVTTFAVVSGVAGAQLAPWIILALGFANLFADGFSMAASNFLGTKAEQDDFQRLGVIENRHIDLAPEGEREEVKADFSVQGI